MFIFGSEDFFSCLCFNLLALLTSDLSQTLSSQIQSELLPGGTSKPRPVLSPGPAVLRCAGCRYPCFSCSGSLVLVRGWSQTRALMCALVPEQQQVSMATQQRWRADIDDFIFVVTQTSPDASCRGFPGSYAGAPSPKTLYPPSSPYWSSGRSLEVQVQV